MNLHQHVPTLKEIYKKRRKKHRVFLFFRSLRIPREICFSRRRQLCVLLACVSLPGQQFVPTRFLKSHWIQHAKKGSILWRVSSWNHDSFLFFKSIFSIWRWVNIYNWECEFFFNLNLKVVCYITTLYQWKPEY